MNVRLAALAVGIAGTCLGPSVLMAQCASGDLACIELPDVTSRPAHLIQAHVGQAGTTSSASTLKPLVAAGDVLPRGEYSIILNAAYYGLSPVSDGWVYMRVGQDAFRVDWDSHEVLERVTDQAAANF